MLRNADVERLRLREFKTFLGQLSSELGVTRNELRQRELSLDLVDNKGRFERLDDRARVP